MSPFVGGWGRKNSLLWRASPSELRGTGCISARARGGTECPPLEGVGGGKNSLLWRVCPTAWRGTSCISARAQGGLECPPLEGVGGGKIVSFGALPSESFRS